ncbi:hypothetical protein VKT23_005843 [Stygiomarasmius scandens]|uniref:Uncharacterized protein n=1 Tax=Marasmiellus scandens TaxID=2682957 RepID=A0ABR1JPU8_9AGAR
MSPDTQLFIALFRSKRFPDEYTKLHWMLIPLDPVRSDTLSGRVRGYQIILSDSQEKPWKTAHTNIVLPESTRPFYGCLYLGSTSLSKEDIQNRMKSESAEQGDTLDLPIFVQQGRGWSCAQWIIRALRKWEEEGLLGFHIGDPSSLYTRVCVLGGALREHLAKDSEDDYVIVDEKREQIVNVNGVETIHLCI